MVPPLLGFHLGSAHGKRLKRKRGKSIDASKKVYNARRRRRQPPAKAGKGFRQRPSFQSAPPKHVATCQRCMKELERPNEHMVATKAWICRRIWSPPAKMEPPAAVEPRTGRPPRWQSAPPAREARRKSLKPGGGRPPMAACRPIDRERSPAQKRPDPNQGAVDPIPQHSHPTGEEAVSCLRRAESRGEIHGDLGLAG